MVWLPCFLTPFSRPPVAVASAGFKGASLDQDFPGQIDFGEALIGYVFLVREYLEVFEHVFRQPDGDRFQGGF